MIASSCGVAFRGFSKSPDVAHRLMCLRGQGLRVSSLPSPARSEYSKCLAILRSGAGEALPPSAALVQFAYFAPPPPGSLSPPSSLPSLRPPHPVSASGKSFRERVRSARIPPGATQPLFPYSYILRHTPRTCPVPCPARVPPQLPSSRSPPLHTLACMPI